MRKSKRKKDVITGQWYWETPLSSRRNLSLAEYIESRTVVDQRSGCWNWITDSKQQWASAVHKELKFGKASVGRASWECFFGPIPEGIDVCHECDNGRCANPTHLFLGTRVDNMRDCVKKKRHSHGERHSHSKLTDAAVLKMRELRANGRSYVSIAKEFGITTAPCWDAINGRSWKHLT